MAGIGDWVGGIGTKLGLPEMGISERLGGSMGMNAPKLGSETIQNYPGTTAAYGGQVQGPTLSGYRPTTGGNTTYNPGASSTGTPSYSTPSYDDGGQSDAARGAVDAEIASLNTDFDRLSAMAQSHMDQLGVERGNALSNLNLQKQDLLTQVGQQKTDVANARDKNIAAAGNVARQTQGSNRNMLRSLGILNSSAGGDILSRPLEAFDEQRANFVSEAQNQSFKLDTFINQKSAELAQAAKEVEDNYASLIGNIQSDLRFSDRERAGAIRSANAALSQRLADIKSSMNLYKQQVDSQKANLALQIAELQGYKFPNFDAGSFIQSNFFNPTTQGYKPQQVGVYSDQDKDRLSALQ